ncbi:hypothetical protein E4U59_000406, partial [Claviceps monticola]
MELKDVMSTRENYDAYQKRMRVFDNGMMENLWKRINKIEVQSEGLWIAATSKAVRRSLPDRRRLDVHQAWMIKRMDEKTLTIEIN